MECEIGAGDHWRDRAGRWALSGGCYGVDCERVSTAPPAARPSRERRLRSDLVAEGERVDCNYAARRT
jgi:hypothetical protein